MAVLSQVSDIQARIQAALRRGDTAEALRLQAQLGQPVSSVADAGPALPLSLDTPSLSALAGRSGGGPQPDKPKPATPSPNITRKDLDDATDKDGRISWWKLLAKTLAVPAATTAIGAALGGEKGAMLGAQAGGSALKGYQEGKATAEEAADRKAKMKLSEMAEASKAPTTRTTYDDQGNVVEQDWDPKAKKWVTTSTGKKPVTPARPERPIPTEKRTIKDQQGMEHYQEKVDGKWVDTAPPGRPTIEKPPKEPAEKPDTQASIKTAISLLADEEEEIRGNPEKGIPGRGTRPKDADGNENLTAPKVYSPEDQARLDEIRQEKADLRSKSKSLLRVLGGGKARKIDEPDPDIPTAADIEKAAQDALNRHMANPDTGDEFKDLDEAKSYFYSQVQKRMSKPKVTP